MSEFTVNNNGRIDFSNAGTQTTPEKRLSVVSPGSIVSILVHRKRNRIGQRRHTPELQR